MVARRRRSGGATQRAKPTSLIGLAIQGVGFALVWGVRRLPGTPLVASAGALRPIAPVLAMVLSIASVMFAVSAIRTLGKEWSLEARVIEGHRLVDQGPYAWVRHPIYTALLGMLLATGLVAGHPTALAAGAAIYCLGTVLRARTEEALLREQFGDVYDAYARRVPAFLPVGPRRRA
jgi:protein-S-isoprenylcysteine O-methyltransferase Ste14